MKVLHINTNPTGGAAIAAYRIHKALLKCNIESHFLTLKELNKDIPNLQTFKQFKNPIWFFVMNLWHRIQSYFYSKSGKYCPISLAYTPFDITSIPNYSTYDIIHLHWVSKFIDYRTFFKKTKVPIVWTLHDMVPFSNGYHYTFQFDKSLHFSILKKNEMIKEEGLVNFKQLQIISPSYWLNNISRESRLFKSYPHKVIRNIVDTDIFKPLKEKISLKTKYGFNKEDKIVLFIADNIEDRRKGIDHFLRIVNRLISDNIKIIFVGATKSLKFSVENIKIFGKISNQYQLAELYNISDVFVISSNEDNYPNTVVEALACGIPVVGFKNSGITEMIIHFQTGYLADNNNEDDLLNGIYEILNSNEKHLISEKCVSFVNENCNSIKNTKEYIKVYQSLI